MAGQSGNPLYDAKVLNTVMSQLASIMTAQTGAGKPHPR